MRHSVRWPPPWVWVMPMGAWLTSTNIAQKMCSLVLLLAYSYFIQVKQSGIIQPNQWHRFHLSEQFKWLGQYNNGNRAYSMDVGWEICEYGYNYMARHISMPLQRVDTCMLLVAPRHTFHLTGHWSHVLPIRRLLMQVQAPVTELQLLSELPVWLQAHAESKKCMD